MATTNLIINPSWETSTAGWTASNLATYERTSSNVRFGRWCCHIADTVSGDTEHFTADYVAVTAGLTYTASAHLRKAVANGAYTGRMNIVWAADGTTLSVSAGELPAGNVTEWTRVTLTATAPATANRAYLRFTDNGITAGDWEMWIDGVQFEEGSAATDYFDGDLPGCAWTGTRHASTSTRTVAVNTNPLLVITDGTTYVDLMAGTDYSVEEDGWAPVIAPLRRSVLGGAGPYADVVETIPLHVFGATVSACLANVAALARLLDQAERLSRGEVVSPVKIYYRPLNSPLLVQALIVGRGPDDQTAGVQHRADYLMGTVTKMLRVQLQFRRRGLWLEPPETTLDSGPGQIPAPLHLLFGSTLEIPSPVRVTVTVPTDAGVADYTLLWASWIGMDRIKAVDTDPMASGLTGFAAVDDAAHLAYGTKVLRYTPASTAMAASATRGLGFSGNVKRVALYAAVRNNSGSATWLITAGVFGLNPTPVYTPAVPINVAHTNPRIVFLGVVALPERARDINLNVQASTTAGPPTLDIDYIVALDVTDDQAGALYVTNPAAGTALTVDTQPLLSTVAAVTKTTASGSVPMSYVGDPFIAVSGTQLWVSLLAVEGAYWRPQTGGSLDSVDAIATFWRAHTAPE
jgi:hypothetical protein